MIENMENSTQNRRFFEEILDVLRSKHLKLYQIQYNNNNININLDQREQVIGLLQRVHDIGARVENLENHIREQENRRPGRNFRGRQHQRQPDNVYTTMNRLEHFRVTYK